jgi:hypothetical protein
MGTFWVVAVEAAESVRFATPLVMLVWLRAAVTPLGKPDTCRFTGPYPNEFTLAVTVAFAADIV